MPLLRVTALLLAFALAWPLPLAAQGPAAGEPSAGDPCLGFKWDISRQRVLFASPPTELSAADKSGASLPVVKTDRLYDVRLVPASGVAFPVRPGTVSTTDDTYAGILALALPSPGSYRIAVDVPLWMDVAAHGELVPAADYEGQHGCQAPRKIVQFALTGGRRWILQLSGSHLPTVRLVVTRVPAP